jgi:hypothetical protein
VSVAPSEIYSSEKEEICTMAGDVMLTCDEIGNGFVVKLNSLVASNFSRFDFQIRLGFVKEHKPYYLRRLSSGMDGHTVSLDRDFVLMSGERPCALFEQANSGDELCLLARGVII